MTEVQSGILFWLSTTLAFMLGWFIHAVLSANDPRDDETLGDEAERLGRLTGEGPREGANSS